MPRKNGFGMTVIGGKVKIPGVKTFNLKSRRCREFRLRLVQIAPVVVFASVPFKSDSGGAMLPTFLVGAYMIAKQHNRIIRVKYGFACAGDIAL